MAGRHRRFSATGGRFIRYVRMLCIRREYAIDCVMSRPEVIEAKPRYVLRGCLTTGIEAPAVPGATGLGRCSVAVFCSQRRVDMTCSGRVGRRRRCNKPMAFGVPAVFHVANEQEQMSLDMSANGVDHAAFSHR